MYIYIYLQCRIQNKFVDNAFRWEFDLLFLIPAKFY